MPPIARPSRWPAASWPSSTAAARAWSVRASGAEWVRVEPASDDGLAGGGVRGGPARPRGPLRAPRVARTACAGTAPGVAAALLNDITDQSTFDKHEHPHDAAPTMEQGLAGAGRSCGDPAGTGAGEGPAGGPGRQPARPAPAGEQAGGRHHHDAPLDADRVPGDLHRRVRRDVLFDLQAPQIHRPPGSQLPRERGGGDRLDDRAFHHRDRHGLRGHAHGGGA